MDVRYLNPQSLNPTSGWSHVAVVQGGRTIYVSGQASVNERGETVGKGDLKVQTEQTFRNLARALEAAGATFEQVVKMGIYVVGLRPEHVPIIREVRARYVSAAQPPTSTLVGISALVGPEWLIEIDVVAVVP